MIPVKAPEGFEGVMYYDDGTRTHKVSFRALGATWWTLCYLDAGHAHLTPEVRMARAESAVRHALTVRRLIPVELIQ